MHSSSIHPGLPCSAETPTAESQRSGSQPRAKPPSSSSPRVIGTGPSALLPPHAALSQCSQGADVLRTNTHLFTKLGAHPCGLHGQAVFQLPYSFLSSLPSLVPNLTSLLSLLQSLSQLVVLSGHKFALHSLLSQRQLDQLLTFCCQRSYSYDGGGSGRGSLEWSQRALQCLLINTLYHGEIAPHLKGLVETEKKEEEDTKQGKHAGVHDSKDSSGRASPYHEFQDVVPVFSQKETNTLVQGEAPDHNDKPQPSNTKIESTKGATAKIETSPKISEVSDTKSFAIKGEDIIIMPLPPKTEEPSTTSPAMVVWSPSMDHPIEKPLSQLNSLSISNTKK